LVYAGLGPVRTLGQLSNKKTKKLIVPLSLWKIAVFLYGSEIGSYPSFVISFIILGFSIGSTLTYKSEKLRFLAIFSRYLIKPVPTPLPR